MASIPQITSTDKLSPQLSFSVLETLYPREVVSDLLSQDGAWERRERKLSHLIMVYLLIVWSFSQGCCLRAVYDRLLRPLRLLGLQLTSTPTSAALCYRRSRLGCRVFRHLMRRCCRPFAPAHSAGFAFGLRLMGIDGTKISVADTPENRACFAGETTSTTAPFPKLSATILVELHTHAIVDAIPATCHVGESQLAKGLLRSLQAGMLVLMDRGFYSIWLMLAVSQRGAHVLGRLACNRLVGPAERILADESALHLLTSPLGESLLVRVITYYLRPEAADLLEQVTPSHSRHGSGTHNPEVRHPHRLITTLLDPLQAPALDLVLLYHERWEVELVIDEIKEHQRLSLHPLLSKHPHRVFQEFYALVLAHYALRVFMGQAAGHAHIDPQRISFLRAVELLTDTLRLAACLPTDTCSPLTERMVHDLSRSDWHLPARRMRFNSRVIKSSRSRFQIKRPDHVFLSATSFPFLVDLQHPTFRELLLI
jgi:Transposase DDE domain/Insertion element 4 transposase N-terminal